MPTRTNTLHGRDRDYLYTTCHLLFLDGECYAFAMALHEGLGWPMVGLMQEGTVRHAAVRSPDGSLFDIRGFVPLEQFGRPFAITTPYDLRELTVNDLRRRGESDFERDRLVRHARRMAEALFPDLPWRDGTLARVTAFCDELEALCRTHKLWIRSPYPTTKPILAIGDGSEGGYEVSITPHGLSYMIDRYFE